MERLEMRRLLAVYTWDGGGDDISFEDPDNWAVEGLLQPDTPPSIADAIVIDLDNGGTPFSIRVTGDQTVNSVTVNAADATLDLRSNSTLTVTTDTIVQQGQLRMENSELTTDTLDNQSLISVIRRNTIDAGTFENDGNLDLVSSSVTATLVNGFTNRGVVNLRSTSSAVQLTVQNGAIVNATGAEINLQAGSGRQEIEVPQIDNAGRIQFFHDDIRFGGDTIINNTGSIDVVADASAITFGGTTLNINDGNVDIDGTFRLGDGALNVSAGTLIVNDELRVDGGPIEISGGEVRNDGTLLANNSDVTFSGGRVIGDNPIELRGNRSLEISHDDLFAAVSRNDRTVSGALHSGQSLTVNQQNSDLIFQPGFVSNGIITFDNPGTSAQGLTTTDGSAFTNASDGVLRFTRSASQNLTAAFITAPIENDGVIEVDASISDRKANTLNNRGTFTVTDNGSYARSSAGGGDGTFSQNDGVLTVDPSGSFGGNGVEFVFNGGIVSGTVTPRDLTLTETATGTGVFRPTNSFSGNVQRGQQLIINTSVDALDSPTNNGTITLIAGQN
ncbi:MAG: hypothetical protein AAFP90_17890, partial [Planctomycetota bacterium]